MAKLSELTECKFTNEELSACLILMHDSGEKRVFKWDNILKSIMDRARNEGLTIKVDKETGNIRIERCEEKSFVPCEHCNTFKMCKREGKCYFDYKNK